MVWEFDIADTGSLKVLDDMTYTNFEKNVYFVSNCDDEDLQSKIHSALLNLKKEADETDERDQNCSKQLSKVKAVIKCDGNKNGCALFKSNEKLQQTVNAMKKSATDATQKYDKLKVKPSSTRS